MSPTSVQDVAERVTAEGLDRLEASMRDERDFTADGAMVAYALVLDAIADLRDARRAIATSAADENERCARLMEENAECFRRSGQRELAWQLDAEARHIRELKR